VDITTANLLIAASLLIGTPFFIVFGTLSDKIGRKPIIMAGCLIAALTYFSVFPMLLKYANPALVAAQETSKVTVTPTRRPAPSRAARSPATSTSPRPATSAKRTLTQSYIPYENKAGPAGSPATITLATRC
jgi:hypothetical protein